jgi:hypothetical protein
MMGIIKFNPSDFYILNVNFVVEHLFRASLDMLNRVVKLKNSGEGIHIPKIRVKMFHFFELREFTLLIMH